MLIHILSKLLSECFLSLYPVFVKNINLPIFVQLWSRFFSYVVISAAFVNYSYIFKHILSFRGLALSLITTLHIYTSYRGFQLLESGISYTIFYLYPIMILIMSGEKIHPIMLLSLIGVYILSRTDDKNTYQEKPEDMENFTPLSPKIEGIIMILGAAATEAAIFFAVRGLKTENHWNHLFLSYFIGAILFTIILGGGNSSSTISNIFEKRELYLSIGINAAIGLFGYLLRFYAMSNLSAHIYAPLSYFGIFMSYVYGVLINGDTITLSKIIGTILILIPNIYFLL